MADWVIEVEFTMSLLGNALSFIPQIISLIKKFSEGVKLQKRGYAVASCGENAFLLKLVRHILTNKAIVR